MGLLITYRNILMMINLMSISIDFNPWFYHGKARDLGDGFFFFYKGSPRRRSVVIYDRAWPRHYFQATITLFSPRLLVTNLVGSSNRSFWTKYHQETELVLSAVFRDKVGAPSCRVTHPDKVSNYAGLEWNGFHVARWTRQTFPSTFSDQRVFL